MGGRVKSKFTILLFLLLSFNVCANQVFFVDSNKRLADFYGRADVILVASPGRSGSTLLTSLARQYATNYDILKTHILPPNRQFIGKIIFIFSNPDKAAESVLHIMINDPVWGKLHFSHVNSSDQEWLKKIGDTTKQTMKDNLLSYDALGCYKQLYEWLCKTEKCDARDAQILAIKYENLWDPMTVEAIKDFLNIGQFNLPPKKERGYAHKKFNNKEVEFKKCYNLGTPSDPKYAAYNRARKIWLQMPAIQYLKLPTIKRVEKNTSSSATNQ